MAIRHPVFVILPLGSVKHVRQIYDEGIMPSLSRLGFEAKRVDDQAVHGGIVDAIREQLEASYFVIADLSGERPNCYYELGYAQAIGKPVLLFAERRARLHFDVAHQMVHRFDHQRPIQRLLKTLVPAFLVTRATDSDDNRNGEFGRRCIRDGYQLTAKVDHCGARSCTITFEVRSLLPSRPLQGSVRFYMHHSYEKTMQPIEARHGLARYEEVTSEGPWTLGAKVMKTGTLLELDLATIPGARPWWYQDA